MQNIFGRHPLYLKKNNQRLWFKLNQHQCDCFVTDTQFGIFNEKIFIKLLKNSHSVLNVTLTFFWEGALQRDFWRLYEHIQII